MVGYSYPGDFLMASHDPAIQYLATTKIGEKGQLTVPKQFREDLGLDPGAPFAVLRMGDALLLLPQQQQFERLCEKMSASMSHAGITEEIALATLPEARRRVFKRRYRPKRHRRN